MKVNSKKKAAAGLLSFLLTASALTGCGVAGDGSGAAAGSVTGNLTENGSWEGTIGDTAVTLKGAYVIDGEEVTIDGGTWASENADETVFLVVNGGSLNIKNATVTKTGGNESSEGSGQKPGTDSSASADQSASSSDSTTDAEGSFSVAQGQGGPAQGQGNPAQGGTAPSGQPPEMNGQGGPGGFARVSEGGITYNAVQAIRMYAQEQGVAMGPGQGSAPTGQPPAKPGSESSTSTDSSNQSAAPSGNRSGAAPGGQGGPGGGGNASGEDAYNFYGLNSAIVCVGEDSNVNIENCTVDTDANGANAVFATDSSNINASGITITTAQNSSRGLYATYGAAITAENVDITTQGAHCAPLATDRGGGTVTVTGENNKLEAHGDGSPCIYSTGDISVENATGSSEVAQTLVIEGKNKVTLKNCDLTSTSENDGIMLYQSMSGDAADEDASSDVSTLTMENTTLHYEGDGRFLYVTNTNTVVNTDGCTFDYDGDTLISAAAGRWGNDGSNGGTLTMNISNQKLAGKAAADSISKITINLGDGASQDLTTDGSVTVK